MNPVYLSCFIGFHRHIITTGLGYGVGWSLHKWFETQSKRRALHVQDYINAHPEHFPELFMRKYPIDPELYRIYQAIRWVFFPL